MFNAGKYLKFFLPLLFIFGLEIAIGAGVPSINSCGIRSAHYLATQAGCDVLEKGGNAFDAAVAVTSALAVVEPFSSGIGGGGFYLLKRANSVDAVFLDAREKAPAKANPSVFVKNGQVIKRLSLDGPTAAAIPGIPAALEYLSDNYGKLRLADTMEASIQLAQEGFEVDERYVKLTNYRINRLKNDTNTSAIFLDGGELPKVGWTLKQLDLAETLRKISIRGAREFYFGSVGKEIFKSIKEGGGLALTFGKCCTVKVPCSVDGLRACKELSNAGIRVNVTLIFSQAQAILAAKAGAKYVSPFVGRVDDNSFGGICLVKDIAKVFKEHFVTTEVLAASIRNVRDVGRLFEHGSDIVTMPPAVFEKMYNHILTDKGLELFQADWESVHSS